LWLPLLLVPPTASLLVLLLLPGVSAAAGLAIGWPWSRADLV
jgi:hypothetical protein